MSIKKTQNGQRKSLMTGASVLAAAAAVMSGAPAFAQDAAEEEDTIVVTGSRLVRQDFEAISPITTVGSEQLELTATLTTESLLNELPQIIPGNTRTSNNAGGEDFATVDLRGLGPTRTLVLINGERVPASSTTGVVDLNTIPASLISRIEVVTGGASAVYGSDAVAGVVNFVLKDDYEGAEINMTYGAEMETGNVPEFEINALVGSNFADGRGNMTTYASYFNREGVLQGEYDYSRVSGAMCYDAGGVDRPVNHAYYICDSVADNGFPTIQGGSGTPPWGWIANQPHFDNTGDGIPDVGTGNPFGSPTTYSCQSAADLADDLICNNSEGDGSPGSASAGAGSALLNAVGGFLSPLTTGQFAAGVRDSNCDGVANATNFNGNGNLSFHPVTGAIMPRNNGGVGNLCSIPLQDIGLQGSSRYNFAPDNFLIIPAERIALTTNGHYDISDDVRLNFLINYSNSRTQVQLAPTPATGIPVTLTPAMRTYIQANHADLWAALGSRPNPFGNFVMDRRTTELGTRNAFNENNSFYFLAGLEGSLGDNWDWSLAATYGQSHFISRLTGSANKTALNQGLAGCQSIDPGPDTLFNTVDDIGVPLGAAALPGCVLVDIFGPNTLTAPMVAFLTTTTFSQTIVEENRISGYVRGDLFEVPAGPVAAVFGFEYRDSQLEFRVDNEQRTGNIYGFNALQDQAGSIDVYEMYTEMSLPLASEQPFAHYLGLEAGYRISNYSTAGNVETYKIGGEWAPTEWLRFRAIFNKATRAPNVFELFQAGDQGFPAFIDPCNALPGGNGVACNAAPGLAQLTFAQQAGFAQNNGQVQAFAFGNPNLAPETAETTTYGFVFQPDWFPIGDFRASVDFYDIEVADVIAGLGAQFYINDCYINGDVAGGCARIVRTAGSGQIFSVNTTRSNQGSLTTEGVDIQAEWSVPIGPGQLTINELYSILESSTFNGFEFSGTTSAAIGGAFPEYKSALSVTYNVGDFTLFGRWTYVPTLVSGAFGLVDDGQPGLGDDNTFPPCPGNAGGCGAVNDFVDDPTESPEASYFDISGRWNIADNFTMTLNIDNVLDQYPPQTADGFFSQANTDPQVYRVLGRTFAVSARYRF
jgi:outer membrane receptor protein involved in Fe transport